VCSQPPKPLISTEIIIYQIVTDRFFDGDPTNNDPPQSSGLFDSTKTNFQA
jgi:hypothetical protein